MVLSGWPDRYDPFGFTIETYIIGYQIFEPLFLRNAKGIFEGVLADKYRFENNYKKLTIDLKKDNYFSNGEQLTAFHVKEALERTAKKRRYLNLDCLIGLEDFLNGKAKEISGIIIINKFCIQFNFSSSSPRIMYTLSDIHAAIYKKLNGKYIGTGPYITLNENEKVIELGANRFSKEKAVYEKVYFLKENDKNDEVSISMRENSKLIRREYFESEVVFLGFNISNKKLKDRDVRISLGNIFEKSDLESIFGKMDYELSGYIPLGLPGHDVSNSFPKSNKNIKDSLKGINEISIHTYNEAYMSFVNLFCERLKSCNILCKKEIVTVNEMINLKPKNSLELFVMRMRPGTKGIEHILGVFTKDTPINFFTQKNTQIASYLDNKFRYIIKENYQNMNILISLYKDMDKYVIENALLKPLNYGSKNQIWVNKNLDFKPYPSWHSSFRVNKI